MRIALAQHTPFPADLDTNLRRAHALITDAAARGAQLVVFPELWLTGYELEAIASTPQLALVPDDARLDDLRGLCQRTGLTAILGAPWQPAEPPIAAPIAANRAREATRGGGNEPALPGQRGRESPLSIDRRPLLAAQILHADGSLHVSAKLNLHGRERDVFRAAPPAPPFELHGWRVAVAICFDVAVPPHAAAAAAAGADLYVGSALYDTTEVRRSDLHFGARAMDHRMFSALANYAGTSGGLTSCGRSGVWRPNGEVLCRAGTEEITLLAELDRAEVEAYRRAT